MLIGSLSNDLMRVANLIHRGSHEGALRFLTEAKRWTKQVSEMEVPDYIKDIANKVQKSTKDDLSLEDAEHYLMQSILLQNYTLHAE